MNKKTGIIVGMIVVVFVGILGVLLWQRQANPSQPSSEGDIANASNTYQRDQIVALAKQIDYKNLDLNSIISAQDMNGNLPENIKGNSKAPVVIYEYADYQCSYCALMNPYINEIVKDHGDKVAVVLRTYILPYHPSGVMVASAVEAAAIQGFWSEYKDLVFANQNDWYDLSGDNLQQRLENYFAKIAGAKGDVEKFRTDMAGEAVRQKVAFDFGAGDAMDIGGTPWFYLDGEWIANDGLSPDKYAEKIRQVIDEKLKAN